MVEFLKIKFKIDVGEVMRAAFFHNHKFYEQTGLIYSNRLPYAVWQRYLFYCEHLCVVGRVIHSTDSMVGYKLSSGKNVDFKFLDFNGGLESFGFVSKKDTEILENIVQRIDFGIIRLPSAIGLAAKKILKKYNKPYVVEVVGCAWDSLIYHGRFELKLLAPIMYWRNRKAVHNSSFLIYVSNEFLQNRYPANGNAVTESVSNVSLVDSDYFLVESRKKKELSSDVPVVIGVIGSLVSRYKGVDIAIAAIECLKRKYNKNIRLEIIGDGDQSLYRSLAKRIGCSEEVFFLGEISSGPAIFKWLDSIDIYIQPSLTEGVPRALIEAMSRGCPSVGSNVGGIPELLSRDFIFPRKNIRKLAELINLLIEDKEKRVFEIERNFNFSKQFYENVLRERRSAVFNKLICFVNEGEKSER